ncbi:MAG: hypothetical protein RSA49_04300 [Anaerovoracaceae bacterium]|uniref:hypothetical protein n=1 Tax=Chryseobacterium sp. TaxID=1871047 RepID=UPI002FCA7619
MNNINKLANMLKTQMTKKETSAITIASASIGVIEQINPLKISTYNGQIFYEEEENEIIKTKLFAAKEIKLGNKVLVVPVENIETIAVIDIVEV